jgi:hypothetical protein
MFMVKFKDVFNIALSSVIPSASLFIMCRRMLSMAYCPIPSSA